MQIYLYIVRHAHALDDAPTDEERPLSEKGWRQTARLCKGLKGKSLITPSEIWHSGYIRARETAEALKHGLELEAPLKKKNGLTPFDNPSNIQESIEEIEHHLMVVGHEPNLSRLASLVLTRTTEFERVVFNKSAILCLSHLKIGKQSTPWQIEWHLNHKHFK